MRIVHLIARLNDGGPARVVANLSHELIRRGHQVSILAGETAADEPDVSATLRAQGLAVEIMPGFGRAIDPLRDLIAAARVVHRLAAIAPDLVHTHTAKAGVLGRLACRWLGLPCLHTYHGHVLDGYFSPGAAAVARAVERLAAGNSHHHALTPSQFVDLHERFGIGSRRRWHVVPVPVTPIVKRRGAWHDQLFKGRPVIGFLGRLAAVKDCDLFLETLAVLNQTKPVQGLVCGDGALRAALEERASRLPVPILFTGFVPAEEAFAALDVLLITSRNEGLPLVAVEAGSCGVPVVAPPVGGLADLCRSGAVLGAERTADSLARSCARLLDDSVLRASQCAGGDSLARRCQPAALASRYEAMYAQICRRR